ncbi:unnamed protein product [Prunus armeniaca]|uniref:Uncharacterized protein n=1 Tax=Prunus armeniaca TaxID=36596 RepID=A0A6J5WN39_PRUAR|nr:unnamed protein product [Prunus armeniaca]
MIFKLSSCLLLRLGLSQNNLLVAKVLYRIHLVNLIRAKVSDLKRVNLRSDRARAMAADFTVKPIDGSNASPAFKPNLPQKGSDAVDVGANSLAVKVEKVDEVENPNSERERERERERGGGLVGFYVGLPRLKVKESKVIVDENKKTGVRVKTIHTSAAPARRRRSSSSNCSSHDYLQHRSNPTGFLEKAQG